MIACRSKVHIKNRKVHLKSSNPEALEALKMKNVVEFGRFSFELEEKREQSIISQANQMLTGFSICSAALLMAIPIMCDETNVPHTQLLIASGFVFFFLIISLVLAVIAQWRFKYEAMICAGDFEDAINKEAHVYKSQKEYDDQWVFQLTAIQRSKKQVNDRRVKLVMASMTSFLTAIGIFLLTAGLFIILYTG